MLFTTPLFLCFFLPIFLLFYYLVPAKGEARNLVALLGSLFFFAWGEPLYVFFLLALVFVDYQCSKAITPQSPLNLSLKKAILGVGIGINVATLLAFKYSHFILQGLLTPWSDQLKGSGPLILGISFIIFHKISYLVDSYKGRAYPPRHFYDCALYIFLFPQLIAGPIIRFHDIGPEIKERHYRSNEFLVGAFRFGLGFAKKILIADPLGVLADRVFALPTTELPFAFSWIGAFSYMLQIYFDFSGYSDMAIGLGLMLGFHFPENFNRPYLAKSITEFWQRWHISLSSWMRLYLYIPLGGNRGSRSRTFANLWIVFLLSGLWHGANWTFIAWGAYYGFFLCLEKYCSEFLPQLKTYLPNFFKFFLTVLIVLFGWVLFRASNLSHALAFFKTMLGFGQLRTSKPWGFLLGNQELFLLGLGAALAFIKLPPLSNPSFHWLKAPWSREVTVEGNTKLSFLFLLSFLLLGAATMGMLSAGHTPFLYFRF